MTSAFAMLARGILLQLVLGTVYAWSFFQKPLVEHFGWSHQGVALTFSLAIFFLGIAAAVGGQLLPKYGPQKLATVGILLYVAGWQLGALALASQQLWLLQLGFGVIGGTGLGLGYVTPVATVSKWFPQRKGFATGAVVMGFGLGALLLSKTVAPAFLALTEKNFAHTFALTGILFAVMAIPATLGLKFPVGEAHHASSLPISRADFRQAVLSRKFIFLWAIFFCNIAAGIMFIGFQSPLLQDLLAKRDSSLSSESLAAWGATLIAASSLFNGLGRFLWGSFSDTFGRNKTFSLITATQAAVFIALPFVENPWLFGSLVCYILLCYGGGFGVMPSTIADAFGSKLMPAVYGAILTAWSSAGIAGPLFAAFAKDTLAANAHLAIFVAGGSLLAMGFILSMRFPK